jgi:hypothetical protein
MPPAGDTDRVAALLAKCRPPRSEWGSPVSDARRSLSPRDSGEEAGCRSHLWWPELGAHIHPFAPGTGLLLLSSPNTLPDEI